MNRRDFFWGVVAGALTAEVCAETPPELLEQAGPTPGIAEWRKRLCPCVCGRIPKVDYTDDPENLILREKFTVQVGCPCLRMHIIGGSDADLEWVAETWAKEVQKTREREAWNAAHG